MAKETESRFTHKFKDEDGNEFTDEFKIGTGPALIDEEKPQIPLDKAEKIIKGFKIGKMPFNRDKPKHLAGRMHKPTYLARCRVHKVLAGIHNELIEMQPVDVSKLIADHPELLEAAKPFKERALKNYIKEYLDTEYYSSPDQRSAAYKRLTKEEVLEQNKFKKDNPEK